jgi:hypothetical protein
MAEVPALIISAVRSDNWAVTRDAAPDKISRDSARTTTIGSRREGVLQHSGRCENGERFDPVYKWAVAVRRAR